MRTYLRNILLVNLMLTVCPLAGVILAIDNYRKIENYKNEIKRINEEIKKMCEELKLEDE